MYSSLKVITVFSRGCGPVCNLRLKEAIYLAEVLLQRATRIRTVYYSPKRMLFPWKQFLLLSGIATLLVDTAVAVKEDQACYGNQNSQSCSQHRLQCQQGSSIFFTQAVRGFKEESRYCFIQRPQCQYVDKCCRNDTSKDCMEVYSQEAFTDLTQYCWNRSTCNYSVRNASNVNCGDKYKSGSGYSKVQYLCLSASNIHSFTDSDEMTVSSLALRYLFPDAPGSYVCLVEAADCSSQTANVLLAKSNSTNNLLMCSSLSVNEEERLPCGPWYAAYTLTTPFRVWLDVVDEYDINQAWAVIHAIDSSKLRVQCKQNTSTDSLSQCPSTSTATTRETTSAVPTTQTTDSTKPDTSVSTAFPSSDGTGASDTSSTSTLASGASSDVTKGTMPQSAENSGNTTAVVGGVVGAVLLVVVVLVAIVFFLKCRSATGKTFKGVAWFKGGNSSRSPHGNSGRAESHVTDAQPTSPPAYDNSAAAISEEAGVRVDPDSDYNHLGQKPTSSASRDVTYGHLTYGSDVTDYGYDHVTKGKPTGRSGEVIDNVYNTAGPATGGSCDEDFYNTTSTAKNRPDVINNVYNTPSPGTDASPDVDYYNTAGLAQRGCDVINNIYDIPK